MSDLAHNLEQVQARIQTAAARSGRTADDIMLVAVTKTHPLTIIHDAYALGLRHFGENRVEESTEKFAQVDDDLPEAVWHMIGHVQSRKTADVAGSRFGWLHSLDRAKIARRLNKDRAPRPPLNVLFQANVSGEASKYGYDLAAWPDRSAGFDTLCADIEQTLTYDHLQVRGLMTLAPYSDDPEDSRPIFARLHDLRAALADRFGAQPFTELSMGMSGDFEVAIEEGATIIRLGTALFGARSY